MESAHKQQQQQAHSIHKVVSPLPKLEKVGSEVSREGKFSPQGVLEIEGPPSHERPQCETPDMGATDIRGQVGKYGVSMCELQLHMYTSKPLTYDNDRLMFP